MDNSQAKVMQDRVNVLRDLIVSKKNNVATGLAMEYLDELQRPLEELELERASILEELHADAHAAAASELESRLAEEEETTRDAAKELLAEYSYADIVRMREDAREELAEVRVRYKHLSAALNVLEAQKRLKEKLGAASSEDIAALAELLGKDVSDLKPLLQ